jgi:hypothetical protein
MTIELVYETHSVTEDNETGLATGWLVPTTTMPVGSRLAARRNAAAPGVVTGLPLTAGTVISRRTRPPRPPPRKPSPRTRTICPQPYS